MILILFISIYNDPEDWSCNGTVKISCKDGRVNVTILEKDSIRTHHKLCIVMMALLKLTEQHEHPSMTKDKRKLRAQVKSRFYYLFWGAATVSVFAGQLYVGSGYRQMSRSFNRIMDAIVVELVPPRHPMMIHQKHQFEDPIQYIND